MSGRAGDPYAGEHQLNLEPESSQRVREQQVLLKAVAAPPVVDELSLEILDRQRDRDASMRVEVLERDRGRVGPVDLGEAGTAAQADPLEVRVEVEHRHEPEGSSWGRWLSAPGTDVDL